MKWKNTLERINRRLNDTEEWIKELKDKVMENTEAEHKKEKWMKINEYTLKDLWDNIKQSNITL